MSILKIVAVLVLSLISTISCSVLAPAVAPVAFRYTQVAPPSVLPFSAQVSTFSRNLHVFDAPYAAGVIPGPPAIVQRAIVPPPATPVFPAPFAAPVAPLLPRIASVGPAIAPVAPFLPRVAPVAPALAPVGPVLPYNGFGGFVGPVGRSIHAVAPGFASAPLLG
ncbi:protein app1-like [Sitophilus oryzae]|uniref:Protein app1-like n=1 Tax=Sitophilus oryzae TaxID=7048 RepID=A0A6J2YPG4_SITOR|nr:protein app1-like [Sitophilus oryzae]